MSCPTDIQDVEQEALATGKPGSEESESREASPESLLSHMQCKLYVNRVMLQAK